MFSFGVLGLMEKPLIFTDLYGPWVPSPPWWWGKSGPGKSDLRSQSAGTVLVGTCWHMKDFWRIYGEICMSYIFCLVLQCMTFWNLDMLHFWPTKNSKTAGVYYNIDYAIKVPQTGFPFSNGTGEDPDREVARSWRCCGEKGGQAFNKTIWYVECLP